MRDRRRATAAVGALMVGLPAAAIAPGTARAAEPPQGTGQQGTVPFSLQSRGIGYGRDVVAIGTTPPAPGTTSPAADQTLDLQLAPAGSSTWRTVAQTTSTAGTRFRLSARVTESGQARVLEARPATDWIAQEGIALGSIRRLVVSALIRIRRQRLDALGSTPVAIQGQLLPGHRGRRVLLQARIGRSWQTVATARTSARGAFAIRYVPAALGSEQLRVAFAGDRFNARARTRTGNLTAFTRSVASWYYDGGATACGFSVYYGVANRTLPCGTAVEFRLGSHQVTAVVDDRGPFVGGRDWDLNQNTASALGLVGVQTVWSTR